MFVNRARARTGTSKGYSHTNDVVHDDKLLELVDVFLWTIQPHKVFPFRTPALPLICLPVISTMPLFAQLLRKCDTVGAML